MIRCLLCATFMLGAAQAAQACQPLSQEFWAETPQRVKANFDGAQFVVVATVIDVKMVNEAKPPYPDFKMKFERATFRVDRAFKGRLRQGDTFKIESGISSCRRGVLHTDWSLTVPGTKTPPDYPKQWMIYYTAYPHIDNSPIQPPDFEITASPLGRPIGQASYDLSILEKMKRH